MQAAKKLGILAPLLHANICKNDVRTLASQFKLHVQDKPAAACLASRIPKGTEVTPERLAQVARAEAALRMFGFEVFRVRHHGEIARLELGAGETSSLDAPELRAAVVLAVKDAGFRFVVLDLEGYRPGGRDVAAAPGRFYSIAPIRESGQ
jgi:uncharacterized protein